MTIQGRQLRSRAIRQEILDAVADQLQQGGRSSFSSTEVRHGGPGESGCTLLTSVSPDQTNRLKAFQLSAIPETILQTAKLIALLEGVELQMTMEAFVPRGEIMRIPHETLVHILHYVVHDQDYPSSLPLVPLRRVCKFWRDVLDTDRSLWGALDVQMHTGSLYPASAHLFQLVSRGQLRVASVRVAVNKDTGSPDDHPSPTGVFHDFLGLLGRESSALEDLRVEAGRQTRLQSVWQGICYSPLLKSLSVRTGIYRSLFWTIPAITSLELVNVRPENVDTATSLDSTLAHLPNLTHLRVQDCEGLVFRSRHTDLSTDLVLPHLQTLWLEGQQAQLGWPGDGGPKVFRIIAPHLRSLVLRNNNRDEDERLLFPHDAEIAANLERFTYVAGFGDDQTSTLIARLAQMTSLRHLVVDGVDLGRLLCEVMVTGGSSRQKDVDLCPALEQLTLGEVSFSESPIEFNGSTLAVRLGLYFDSRAGRSDGRTKRLASLSVPLGKMERDARIWLREQVDELWNSSMTPPLRVDSVDEIFLSVQTKTNSDTDAKTDHPARSPHQRS